MKSKSGKKLTAYNIFVSEQTEILKKKNPKLKQSEILQIIAYLWHRLDEDEKDTYYYQVENGFLLNSN